MIGLDSESVLARMRASTAPPKVSSLAASLTRSAIGLLAGAALICVIIAAAFESWRALWKMILILFLANAAGYFAGVVIEIALREFKSPAVHVAMQVSWGIFFGVGFGAGLGAAFHLSQRKIRDLLLV